MNGATANVETSVPKTEAPPVFEAAGEQDPERIFEQKGADGLMKVASTEAHSLSMQFDTLSTFEPESTTFAPMETTELKQTADSAKQSLEKALQSLEADLKRSTGETDLSAEVRTEEAAEEGEAAEPVPLIKMKAVGVEELPSAEGLEIEPTVSAQAKEAMAANVPVGRESAQEELEAPSEEAPAPPIDWENLKREETAKLESAKKDYEQVNQTLREFKESREKGMTPIENKYLKALETQIQMDELSLKHAENQIDLYDVNEKIETLSHGGDVVSSEIDQLIERRNAKDALSRELADAQEKAEQTHEAALAAYMKALEALQAHPSDSVEAEAGDDQEASEEEGEEPTEPVVGMEKAAKKPLTLNPEDEQYEANQHRKKSETALGDVFGGLGAGIGAEEKKGAPFKKQKPGLAKRFFGSWWNWVKK